MLFGKTRSVIDNTGKIRHHIACVTEYSFSLKSADKDEVGHNNICNGKLSL